tara:strand:- start:858 stop:2228 length:1371 start_codon:yes stop_codon:yes gene_type:complete
MNKIKQNKITFNLILCVLAIIFSSLTILSLPVLFNYKSKVPVIEKNFYKNFKIYVKTSGEIKYKPFPKPHLLVENASLNFDNSSKKNDLISTSNLKIYISLKDIYLRSFSNFLSTKISNSNLDFKMEDIKELRKHLYQKVNKPIYLDNCKIFIRNEDMEVILISPIKKVSYKIDKKNKIKNFKLIGEIFGLNFKSDWRRDYKSPKTSIHIINIFNLNLEIKNIFEFESTHNFKGQSRMSYSQSKMEYNLVFEDNIVKFISPKQKKNLNFILEGSAQLKPFYFNGKLLIKDKKIGLIIDNLLSKLYLYDEKIIGNFNGKLKIKFDELDNKLIRNGEIKLVINEKKIIFNEANFKLNKIGSIKTNIKFTEDNDTTRFISKNKLDVKNHIEFAKTFQVGSKKAKDIQEIYFDLEKELGSSDLILKNVKINSSGKFTNSDGIFVVKNIQNLRSYIRKVID